MSPPGRPKGEYRSAQHEGRPVSQVLANLLQVHFPHFGFQIRKATTS